MSYNLCGKRIWVAGHKGMVGAAVSRRLELEDCCIIQVSRESLDLTDQVAVLKWMRKENPEIIVIAAAKVGGIHANNTMPVDFLETNLLIQTNILKAAHLCDVKRLLFLGSSCIYPKHAKQPIDESSLLTGPLEETNEWYAIAKIAGIRLCQAYRKQYKRDWISAMPTNLYGPGDNYNLNNSHVLPALLKKFHESRVKREKEVSIWGSGSPLREFLHCDDLADAIIFLLKNYSGHDHINIGSGEEVSIKELAETIAKIVGSEAKLKFDNTRPDGTPRKFLDSSRLNNLGWNNARTLESGVKSTYANWLQNEI